MKQSFLLFCCLCTCLLTSNAQYKNDNKLFKTVYMDDLCSALRMNPGHLVLDVRSKGEYSDTSTADNLNIGHLKDAVNIDIREMPTRWKEIASYKDKPVFVYCSHSQRSRRVSKLLSDSGFTNIININGGLTTFNLLRSSMNECPPELYETSNKYQLSSPASICQLNKKDYVLVDIRSDSVYKGISSEEYLNPWGKLKQAIHIPRESLPSSLNKLPADKTIILVDEYGGESPKAARMLYDKGYKKVVVMFGGMEGWMGTSSELLPCKNEWLQYSRSYQLLPADDLGALMTKKQNAQFIDIRKAEEFNNTSPEAFRNVGQINGARNYPAASLAEHEKELQSFKDKPVILYAFSNQPELFTSAQWFSEKGFKEVYVLLGGIFNLRWRAANIKNKASLADWVVNIPPANQ